MRFRRLFLAFLVVCLAILPAAFVSAEEMTTADVENNTANSAVVEIYDYNDLLRIKNDPAGTYKLMADIDLSEVMWEPLNFEGTLDGNGHAVLNVTINQTGQQTRKTYDGNRVDYDSCFSGFFGILENATVSNLSILGVKINLQEDSSCFVGGVAGFMENSRVSDVKIEGEAALYTKGPSFGIGGIAGFGNGQIENCISEMTLICVDEDVENKDEQFMGGAYAAGYIDLNRNDITIHGYDSDHGYVHNGGLAGMYILYSSEEAHQGYVTNNKVSGGISFFEDNEDRRAYCEPYIGEVMNWTFTDDGNEESFAADEHFEYDTDLMPHSCPEPAYQDVITPSTHTEYGYTTHNCTICGEYSYRSNYTPLAHEVENWTVTAEPTDEEEGIRQGSCKECGAVVFERVPKVSAQEAGEAESEAQKAEVLPEKSGSAGKTVLIVVVILVILVAVWLLYARYRRVQIQKAKKARRAAQKKAAERRMAEKRAAEKRAAGAGRSVKHDGRQNRTSKSGGKRPPQKSRPKHTGRD